MKGGKSRKPKKKLQNLQKRKKKNHIFHCICQLKFEDHFKIKQKVHRAIIL